MKTKNLISKFILPLLILPFILISCNKKENSSFTVAFYDLSDKTAEGLEETFTEMYKDSSKTINFKYVEDEKELKNLIRNKSVHIVFTTAGNNQRTCVSMANKNSAITNQISADFTSSVRQNIISDNNSILALPFLTDNFEIDINLYDFRVSKVEAINTWDDVEKFLVTQKRSKEFPLYFAGADPVNFFDMLGALCEAIDGQKYYQQALDILDKGGAPKEVAYELIGSPSSPMVNTSNLLKGYFRKGFISQDSFNLNPKDLERYAQEDYAKMMIMSLSDHRTIKYDAIRRYSSAYIPSEFPASHRTFTANSVYAIPVTKNTESSVLIEKLLQDEVQANLSRATGLAPVTRNSRTPDKQADDARYWVAATNPPFAGLGHDTKLSKDDLSKIKDSIKNILLYE